MAVGDIMFEREVKQAQLKRGWTYPFEKVAPTLKGAGLAFANPECPWGSGWPVPQHVPGRAGVSMGPCHGGVDVVSLANNHILDYDNQVFFQTMDILGEAGTAFAGAGRNQRRPEPPHRGTGV